MFTIDSDNIITYSDADQVPDGAKKFVAEKELASVAANWPADRLVEIWNSFAGVAGFGADLKPVRKFTNRQTGVRRIWGAIQKLDGAAAEAATETAPGARKAAQVAPKKADTKAEILNRL